MSDFYSAKKVKARKNHKCDLCRTEIQKGEIYVKVAQTFQGEFFSSKYHELCNEMMNEYWQELDDVDKDMGITHDEVREHYKLHLPHQTIN